MNLFDLTFPTMKSFFSHECEKVQYPLTGASDTTNGPAMDEKYMDDEYLNSCLYRSCGISALMKSKSSKPDAGKMQFNLGLERVVAHLLIPEIYPDAKGYGGYGFDAEGNFYADYWDNPAEDFNDKIDSGVLKFSDGNHQIFKITPKCAISAYIVNNMGGKKQLIIDCKANAMNKGEKHSSSGVLYALVAYMFSLYKLNPSYKGCEVTEIMKKHFDDAVANYGISGNQKRFVEAVRCLDNDIYTLFNYSADVSKKYPLPFNMLNIDRTEYPLLKDEDITVKEMVGDSIYLSGEKIVAATGGFKNTDDMPNEKTLADIVSEGKYILDSTREFTDEEKALMSDKYDNYVPDRKVLTAAELIKESRALNIPSNNIFWSGSTGTGKSTSSQMLAKMLGLPYVFLTISPDTLLSDLYVNILPATEADKDSLDALTESLPSPTEIALDPVDAYKRITGKVREDVTENDCQIAIREKYYELYNKSNGFIKVESPLVQAFRKGYCIEIQEANTCNKPGVLAGINAALDDLATIELPTGEVVKRHPDTVVIMTANIGYAGRRAMDESVIGRMHIVDNFELPEDDRLVEDLSNQTGCTDEDIIKKMLVCQKAFTKTLVDNGYSDSCCGRRELVSWIKNYMIFKDPYRAAMTSIINKLDLVVQNLSGGIDKDIKPLLLADLELSFHKTGMPSDDILTY